MAFPAQDELEVGLGGLHFAEAEGSGSLASDKQGRFPESAAALSWLGRRLLPGLEVRPPGRAFIGAGAKRPKKGLVHARPVHPVKGWFDCTTRR